MILKTVCYNCIKVVYANIIETTESNIQTKTTVCSECNSDIEVSMCVVDVRLESLTGMSKNLSVRDTRYYEQELKRTLDED